jgi:hypothetical protein
VTEIGDSAFSGCSGLTHLELPAGVTEIGNGAFIGVKNLMRLTLLGQPLSQPVIASLEGCLAKNARVVGQSRWGQKFGRFEIVAG